MLQNKFVSLKESKSEKTEHGQVVILLATVLLLIIAAVFALYFLFGRVVTPDTIGLRQNYFGMPLILSKGFEERGLAPGLHWQIPAVSQVHLMPRALQLIHLRGETSSGKLNLTRLEIPTTDGSKVQTNLTLVFRFFEEPKQIPTAEKNQPVLKDPKGVPLAVPSYVSHGGPKELVNTFTTSRDVQLSTLVKISEDYLKRSLSTLSTSDYYNPVLREAAALHANSEINKQVGPAGVGIWATLIQRYVYAEKNIDDQIFAKNLQDQTERLNAALSALAEARANTEETRATWDAKINVLRAEGESKARVIESEASRYEKEKYAQGEKLLALATAEVETAKSSAYAGPGGDIFVARKMLPILGTLKGGVVSGFDPFDVSSWVTRLMPPANATSRTAAKTPIAPPVRAPVSFHPPTNPGSAASTTTGSAATEGGDR